MPQLMIEWDMHQTELRGQKAILAFIISYIGSGLYSVCEMSKGDEAGWRKNQFTLETLCFVFSTHRHTFRTQTCFDILPETNQLCFKLVLCSSRRWKLQGEISWMVCRTFRPLFLCVWGMSTHRTKNRFMLKCLMYRGRLRFWSHFLNVLCCCFSEEVCQN